MLADDRRSALPTKIFARVVLQGEEVFLTAAKLAPVLFYGECETGISLANGYLLALGLGGLAPEDKKQAKSKGVETSVEIAN